MVEEQKSVLCLSETSCYTECGDHENPELFWSICNGCRQMVFGIVTYPNPYYDIPPYLVSQDGDTYDMSFFGYKIDENNGTY
jgi:hypothetical protein